MEQQVETYCREGFPAGQPTPASQPEPEPRSRGCHALADPFGARATFSAELPAEAPAYLILVPTNRSADTFSVLGFEATEVISNDEITSVLRSWEERFAAVLTTLVPVEVVVDRPLRSRSDTARLAAEQLAFAPEGDDASGFRSKHYWVFHWPD
jgi:hypothetical protein